MNKGKFGKCKFVYTIGHCLLDSLYYRLYRLYGLYRTIVRKKVQFITWMNVCSNNVCSDHMARENEVLDQGILFFVVVESQYVFEHTQVHANLSTTGQHAIYRLKWNQNFIFKESLTSSFVEEKANSLIFKTKLNEFDSNIVYTPIWVANTVRQYNWLRFTWQATHTQQFVV